VSLTVTLASVLVLEIFAHPTAALILHPCIVLVTIVRSAVQPFIRVHMFIHVPTYRTSCLYVEFHVFRISCLYVELQA
jgi:hypothetical protein